MKENKKDKLELFLNRELSWVQFNQRVLEEAFDEGNPLLERVKFLAIVSSNLDEFFMVRVAALKQQVLAGYDKSDESGLKPKKQLKQLSQAIQQQVVMQYDCWNNLLAPSLKEQQIFLLNPEELNSKQEAYLDSFFSELVFPVLTPMAIDPSRPFPFLASKSLNICLLLQPNVATNATTNVLPQPIELSSLGTFAVVQVPSVLNRLVPLPASNKEKHFILLEQVIMRYLHQLFHGYQVLGSAPFRITRNADIPINEEDAEDLLSKIEQWLKLRQRGTTIRLEIAAQALPEIRDFLQEKLQIHKGELYEVPGPVDFTFLMKTLGLSDKKKFYFPKFKPVVPKEFREEQDIFKVIKEKDRFLHHPYHSFQPVTDLVNQAAKDPQVLAIKQTLYRVSGDSPVVKALAKAAEKGKQVTVVVEIKARFDEEKNIKWAKKLEEAGCHVIFGLVGLKVHAKLLLVVRQEEDGICRYLHLGTGNYNDVTAGIYTDMSILTCNQDLGTDVSALFNMLTGYSVQTQWQKLGVAPLGLRQQFINSIHREINNVKAGGSGHIIAKMNSLTDPELIDHLYQASQGGVKVDLVVRGMCSLVPQVPQVSDNIRVVSIVGRFLEHSRIYYFFNNGNDQLFLSSADWMPRNMDRRVETLFPIEDEIIKKEILHTLELSLLDNVKARHLTAKGDYIRPPILDGQEAINLQQQLMERVKLQNPDSSASEVLLPFVPIMSEISQ